MLFILGFTISLNRVHASEKPPHYHIKYQHKALLKKIAEPSDIIYDPSSSHLFIVSDHGHLYECDSNGVIIKKAEKGGLDFEGVEIKDGKVYVSDESPRVVYEYDKENLHVTNTFYLKWGGAINKAFESIMWNEARHCFVLVTEQPAVIVEYSDHFAELRRARFNHTRDVASARWYNGYVYLLSDLEHCIVKCDAHTYEPLAFYTFDILNPEGFTFGPSGKLFVISDNAQKIYTFSQNQIQ